MENFNIHDLRPFAFLITGSIFILLAIFRRSKQAVLKKKWTSSRLLLAIAGLVLLALGIYQLLAPK